MMFFFLIMLESNHSWLNKMFITKIEENKN